MKALALALVVGASGSIAYAAQQPARRMPMLPAISASQVAEAYQQFLLARHLEGRDDIDGAIAALKRAIALDPDAADVVAELASLHLRQSHLPEAIATAEQALRIAPANTEAHRVLGIIYAALADGADAAATRSGAPAPSGKNLSSAIEHLEQALGDSDPTSRATLARLYVRTRAFTKAIPLLVELVNQDSGWPDGPMLLVEAYVGARRTGEAIAWLETAVETDPSFYPTLGDLYERERRWKDAAGAYLRAMQRTPRSTEIKTRYASVLLNTEDPLDAGKARDVLNEVLVARPNDPRVLYMLSQAQRRLGELDAAEATARRVIAGTPKSVWGYYALAEALESRRQYPAVLDALLPAVADFRARPSADPYELTLLLPHVGFAHQQLGQHDKALAVFDEAHRLAPQDDSVTAYLIQANLAAKKFAAAASLAREARKTRPGDLRLARLEAQALREGGNVDQAVAVLQDAVKTHPGNPVAYVALAQAYSDADRGTQAVTLLQEAQLRFPSDSSIAFELGAVFDKQKRFAEAEAAFKRVIAGDPRNAAALNYLGYILAERGERLDESVAYIEKALQLEPDNGSFLDSLGWAYFKAEKLDLAERNLKRAADQLQANSVVQDHYGELLFKRGSFEEAIAAWTRALAGDGDAIDRKDIDRKIRAAKQKLEKK